MPEIFFSAWDIAAFTGKWHLDGGGYYGEGEAGGGFEPEWWQRRLLLRILVKTP